MAAIDLTGGLLEDFPRAKPEGNLQEQYKFRALISEIETLQLMFFEKNS